MQINVSPIRRCRQKQVLVPVWAGARGFVVKNGDRAGHWGTGLTSSRKRHFCFISFSRETSAYTGHFFCYPALAGLYSRKIKEGEVIRSLEEHLQDWAERASSLAVPLRRHAPAARPAPAPALGQVEPGPRALNVIPSCLAGPTPLGTGEPKRTLDRGMGRLLCFGAASSTAREKQGLQAGGRREGSLRTS